MSGGKAYYYVWVSETQATVVGDNGKVIGSVTLPAGTTRDQLPRNDAGQVDWDQVEGESFAGAAEEYFEDGDVITPRPQPVPPPSSDTPPPDRGPSDRDTGTQPTDGSTPRDPADNGGPDPRDIDDEYPTEDEFPPSDDDEEDPQDEEDESGDDEDVEWEDEFDEEDFDEEEDDDGGGGDPEELADAAEEARERAAAARQLAEEFEAFGDEAEDRAEDVVEAGEEEADDWRSRASRPADVTVGTPAQPAAPEVQTRAGEPVDPRSGAWLCTHVDARLIGADGGLVIERRYSNQAYVLGVFGLGWSSLFDARVRPLATGACYVSFGDGTGAFFGPIRNGRRAAPAHSEAELARSADGGYTLRPDADRTLRFDTNGRLLRVELLGRVAATIVRTAAGLPVRVEDGFGHRLEITTNTAGRIVEIRDALQRRWEYRYDVLQRLVEVRAPRDASGATGRRVSFEYLPSASDPRLRAAITAARLPSGGVLVRNHYATTGPDVNRVVEQQHAGGRWTFSYRRAAAAAAQPLDLDSTTAIVGPTGALTEIDYARAGLPLRQRARVDGVWQAMQWLYDAERRPRELRLPGGATLVYQWATPGGRSRVVSITRRAPDGRRRTLQYVYDGAGRVRTAVLSDGGRVDLERDAAGRVVVVRAPAAAMAAGGVQRPVTRLEYDTLGRLKSLLGPDGVPAVYAYATGPGGNCASVRVAGVEVARAGYDAAGRMVSHLDERGRTATIEWSAGDLVLQERWSDGTQRRFAYDVDDNLMAVEDANVDDQGQPAAPAWLRTEFRYDPWGRVLEDSRPLDGASRSARRYEWDPAGRLTAYMDALGHRAEQYYDERGLCVRQVEARGTPAEASRTIAYDPLGNPVELRQPSGAIERYEWDGFEQLVKRQHADGSRQEFRWDDAGRLVEQKLFDASNVLRGHRTAAFDSLGRLTSVRERAIDAVGVAGRWYATTTAFDLAGRPVIHTGPTGVQTRFTWGADGTLNGVDDGSGERTQLRYDARRRLAGIDSVTTAGVLINGLQFEYDGGGRCAAARDPLGNVERYRYDGFGRAVRVARADGVEQRYTYYASGALRSVDVALPGGSAGIEMAYDAAGRLSRIVDPDGVATQLQYDALGRVTAAGPPAGTPWFERRYDAQGRVRQSRDPRGVVADCQHDARDRLVSRRWSGPGVAAGALEAYGYDVYGNVITASAGGHSYSASFDSLGRCEAESVNGQRTSYTHSADLSQVTISSPSGAVSRCEHDAHGRLVSTQSSAPGVTPVVSTYRWLDASRLSEAVHGAARTSYRYDRAGRLLQADTAVGSTSIETLTWLRDAIGRPAVRLRARFDARSWDRDAMGQVTAERRGSAGVAPSLAPWQPGGSGTQVTLDQLIAQWRARTALARSWTYTPGGDRIRVARGASGVNFARNSAHQYTRVGASAINHDAAGNVTRTPRYDLAYDHAGRLTEIRERATGQLTTLTYDPLGRLLRASAGTVTTTYAYAGARRIDESGPAGARRHWAPGPGADQPSALLTPSGARTLLRDDTWSVVALLDVNGQVLERYDWDAFGELDGVLDAQFRSASPAGAAAAADFHGRPALAAQIRDHRQRVLLVELGRFAQRDPLLLADPNPYRFVLNDPLWLVDPDGDIFWVPILVGAAVGGVVAWMANRDKSGWDLAIAIGAGVAGGALGGAGLGVVGMALGGAVSGGIPAAAEGYKHGGARGALTAGMIGAAGGAVAGIVGGTMGAKFSTAVAGQAYASLTRGVASSALKVMGTTIRADGAAFVSSYAGTVSGGAVGGATGSLAGGTTSGTLLSLAQGGDVADSLTRGIASGVAGMRDGALYGAAGGGLSKSLMQSAWYYQTRTTSGVLGAEAEYFVSEQTGNSKATTKLSGGAEPDLWGDALPWRKPVYGDSKNTAAIPALGKQPSKASDQGQLKQIYDAIPNRYNQQTQPNGNRMTVFYRPGVPTPSRPNHSMWSGLQNGTIRLVPIEQFVLAPWGAGLQSC
jgi:RHS repeat-associated protein